MQSWYGLKVLKCIEKKSIFSRELGEKNKKKKNKVFTNMWECDKVTTNLKTIQRWQERVNMEMFFRECMFGENA